jgi:hypothetical protein
MTELSFHAGCRLSIIEILLAWPERLEALYLTRCSCTPYPFQMLGETEDQDLRPPCSILQGSLDAHKDTLVRLHLDWEPTSDVLGIDRLWDSRTHQASHVLDHLDLRGFSALQELTIHRGMTQDSVTLIPHILAPRLKSFTWLWTQSEEDHPHGYRKAFFDEPHAGWLMALAKEAGKRMVPLEHLRVKLEALGMFYHFLQADKASPRSLTVTAALESMVYPLDLLDEVNRTILQNSVELRAEWLDPHLTREEFYVERRQALLYIQERKRRLARLASLGVSYSFYPILGLTRRVVDGVPEYFDSEPNGDKPDEVWI